MEVLVAPWRLAVVDAGQAIQGPAYLKGEWPTQGLHLLIAQRLQLVLAGVEGQGFRIQAPLQNMSKAEIVQAGVQQGVDYALTVSCYQADDQGRACGHCDACRLRAAGFADASVPDPTHYA